LPRFSVVTRQNLCSGSWVELTHRRLETRTDPFPRACCQVTLACVKRFASRGWPLRGAPNRQCTDGCESYTEEPDGGREVVSRQEDRSHVLNRGKRVWPTHRRLAPSVPAHQASCGLASEAEERANSTLNRVAHVEVFHCLNHHGHPGVAQLFGHCARVDQPIGRRRARPRALD